MKRLLFIYILFTCSINAQWVQYSTPVGGPIDNIHFFNKDIGIITSGEKVFKSIDGGENWTNTNLTLPSPNVFIVDTLYWYSINSEGFYRTTNGGASWIKNELPGSGDKIFFINKNVGFLSGYGQVLRTTDGGLTWSLNFSLENNLMITNFSFCNDSVGVAGGSQYIIKTTDSGKTWNRILLPDNYNYYSGVCLSNSKLVTIMWNEKQLKYEVLVSSDGGNSWESSLVFNRLPNEIAFASDSIGFVIGTAIYKTTNSGKNWFVQTDPNIIPVKSYRKLFVLNENYGWMTNYWDLVRTENGGGDRFHFFNIDYPNTGDTLSALTEIKIKWSNFSSRKDLNIKFSSDNGQTWINLASGFSSDNNFYWTVPNTPSDKSKLLIENNADISEWEETGNFTIAPPPPLILRYPGRGALIRGGDYYNITWLAFSVDKINIEFSSDSGLNWQTVANSYPADSLQYKWRAPLVSSTNCLIKITDAANPSVYSISNHIFWIQLPNLGILYPEWNNVFRSGDIKLLQLAGDYRGSIKLEFTSDNGKSWQFIDSLNSLSWGQDFITYWYVWSQLYQWTVPETNSDSCKLKLTAYESDEVTGGSAIFRIHNSLSIQGLIDDALPGDTIYLKDPEYFECIQINKPITIIGDGINQTKITGDTLKPVIIIQSNKVVIKNLIVTAKTKSYGTFLNCSNYIPTNGMEILNSYDVILDSLQINGGEDISSNGFTSGGTGLFIENSNNVDISNTKIFGANTKGRDESYYSCSDEKGGDGLKILYCDSLNIFNCEITGGKGGNGWAMGAGPYRGGDGGNSLNLNSSLKIKIMNSHLLGGTGGATALSTTTYTDQAKGGDGAYCYSSNAIFFNSILEGGIAFLRPPRPDLPLNTLGGNGITAVNNSNVTIDGGNLIRGLSSEDANGMLYYFDSSSKITFKNLDSHEFPIAFLLEQNYPNPFNISTTIRYSVPEHSYVTLKVFDLLGREVATLVNEEKPAGIYKVNFNGNGLASGIYFYKIQTINFVEVKKMILMK